MTVGAVRLLRQFLVRAWVDALLVRAMRLSCLIALISTWSFSSAWELLNVSHKWLLLSNRWAVSLRLSSVYSFLGRPSDRSSDRVRHVLSFALLIYHTSLKRAATSARRSFSLHGTHITLLQIASICNLSNPGHVSRSGVLWDRLFSSRIHCGRLLFSIDKVSCSRSDSCGLIDRSNRFSRCRRLILFKRSMTSSWIRRSFLVLRDSCRIHSTLVNSGCYFESWRS